MKNMEKEIEKKCEILSLLKTGHAVRVRSGKMLTVYLNSAKGEGLTGDCHLMTKSADLLSFTDYESDLRFYGSDEYDIMEIYEYKDVRDPLCFDYNSKRKVIWERPVESVYSVSVVGRKEVSYITPRNGERLERGDVIVLESFKHLWAQQYIGFVNNRVLGEEIEKLPSVTRTVVEVLKREISCERCGYQFLESDSIYCCEDDGNKVDYCEDCWERHTTDARGVTNLVIS